VSTQFFCILPAFNSNGLSLFPATFFVNVDKPECNGPCIVYEVPDFPGLKEGEEHKGFYIILPADRRYIDLDQHEEFYTARVIASHTVQIKLPAWPYSLWPHGEIRPVYDSIIEQVPECVSRSMNDAHNKVDKSSSMGQESRKWNYINLDFSRVESAQRMNLDSSILFDGAGDEQILDYELIEVPLVWRWLKNEVGQTVQKILARETVLGFRVGLKSTESGRKTKRVNVARSKLAQKMAAKTTKAEGTMDE
jgi:hypothetical protein